MGGCPTCHNSNTFFPDVNDSRRFSDQSSAYTFAVARSNASNPDGSTLLIKASGGNSHTGGAVWPLNGPAYNTAKSWMTTGMVP
jgi:hypothetical protein